MFTSESSSQSYLLGGSPVIVDEKTFSRFCTIWPDLNKPKNPRLTLQRLLNSAEKVSTTDSQFDQEALISFDNIRVTEIYKNSQWIFVAGIHNQSLKLLYVTINNGRYKDYKNSRFLRRWAIDQMVHYVNRTTKNSKQCDSSFFPSFTKIKSLQEPEQEDKEGAKTEIQKIPEDDSMVMEFHGDMVVIDDHALLRFVQRSPDLKVNGIIPHPIRKLKRLFRNSEQKNAIRDVNRTRRLLSHGFKEAEYWRNSSWRFVVIKDMPEKGKKLLKTVERVF